MSRVRYSYKGGFRSKVKPQVAGPALERIRRQHGMLTPDIVLDEAADNDHPLHEHFCWDDTEAAARYRKQQASQLIVCIRVVMTKDPEQKPRMAYLNVRRWHKNSHYLTAPEALSDADVREKIIERARMDAQAYTDRYSEIRELADLCDLMDKAAAKLKPRKKKKAPTKKKRKAVKA